MNARMHGCMYVGMSIRARAYVCVYICIHTHTHIDIPTRATVVPYSALPAQCMGRLWDRAFGDKR